MRGRRGRWHPINWVGATLTYLAAGGALVAAVYLAVFDHETHLSPGAWVLFGCLVAVGILALL